MFKRLTAVGAVIGFMALAVGVADDELDCG